MKRRRFLVVGASGVVPTIAGCSGGGGGGGMETTTTGAKSTSTIAMVDTSFDPVRASVAPGTEVTWTNKDSVAHTVTSAQFHDVAADWSFSSGDVAGGESVSHTFEEKGIYEYYCTIHGKSTMCGVVLVGDVSLEKSLPCEEGGGGGGGYY